MSAPLEDLVRSAWKIIPHFDCSDMQQSIDFYVNDLGFKLDGQHGGSLGSTTEPIACSIFIGRKADAYIYLFKKADVVPSKAMIAMGPEQVDEYYTTLKQRGKVKIVEELEDRPWGYRQFEIEDPDGNKLQFFKFLQGGNGDT